MHINGMAVHVGVATYESVTLAAGTFDLATVRFLPYDRRCLLHEILP